MKCFTCRGSGLVMERDFDENFQREDCFRCKGSGQLPDDYLDRLQGIEGEADEIDD